MKRLLLSGIIALSSVHAIASHFAGGEIRYEFNGTNYTVNVALYKMCSAASANLPSLVQVNFKSASTSQNFNVNFSLTGYDTVNLACPPFPSLCQSSTATTPGYITGNYSSVVTLPAQATDWIISTNLSARAPSVNVSQNSINFYLEATLNNSTAINSSPWIPNKPNHFSAVNQTTYIPLQILDAEGDSVAVDIISALAASGNPVLYGVGYSGASPFGTGGTCQIVNNNTLAIKSTQVGNFVVALKVKDYRNGVQVGSYIREVMYSVFQGTSAFTFTTPTSSASAFTIFTCPGQSNNVTVNFMDSTSTDSVILTVTSPTITGWSFTPTVTNGLGTGSANVTWTTPTTLNPATLPFFYIHIRARDNGCPRAYADYSILVRTRPCTADSVWPGDANGDKTVNIYDPLAIAIAHGSTGPARSGATTTWVAQAATNWGTTYVTNNIDYKHGDCNGDGTINSTDLGAVTSNWGLWHLKVTGGGNKITGAPDLYMDITGINFIPGTTVNIPIKLGSSASPANNVYGLATVVGVSGMMPVNAPVLSTTTSWIGNSSNSLNFTHSPANNVVYWSHAGTDQQGRTGQGVIGHIQLAIPNEAKQGDKVTLSFDMTKLVDKSGNEITTFNEVSTVATIMAKTGVTAVNDGIEYMAVVPNPSSSVAELRFAVKEAGNINIAVVDLVGKTVWQQVNIAEAGSHVVNLPAHLAPGMYTIQLSGEHTQAQIAKWIKQ